MIINNFSNSFQQQKSKKNYSVNFGTLLNGFPRNVEVGISKNCNLRCNYCPNTFFKQNPSEQVMPMSLFEKILTDLKKIDFDGTFVFHRFNEPLLVDVEKYIKKAKEILPKINAELFTNGTLLNNSRLEKLQKTPIDAIIVTQRTKKGFIDKLKEIPDDLLKNVRVKYAEEISLVNRAGAIESLEKTLEEPCYAIRNSFVSDINGQVPLCIDDYYSKVILGDLKKESVEEVWNNLFSKSIREELDKGNRKNIGICKKCDRTVQKRNLNQDFSKNEALYRKKLLLETGSAHIK